MNRRVCRVSSDRIKKVLSVQKAILQASSDGFAAV